MTKIMVSGANGQLGMSIKDISVQYDKMSFVFLNKKQLDISNRDNFEEQVIIHKPDFYINTAAYTAVDRAENDIEKAYLINADSLQFIGEICAENNVKVLHISSDYVYHSTLNKKLSETSPTLPKGIYAKSKLQGEKLLLNTAAESIIIRTSWVYSEHGTNFVKTMLMLADKRDKISIVNDQMGAPTYSRDLAQAILHIVQHTLDNKVDWTGEIYNYCNLNDTNWHDFAVYIFNEMRIQVDIKGIPTSSYPTPAERPRNSRLNTSKIIQDWNLSIRSWHDACNEMLINYTNMINGKS